MEEAAKDRIANMLNCKLGNLSMKYLGIPISDSKLGKGAFVELNGKVSKSIPPWRGKQSSSGGRLMHPHRHNGLLSTTLGTHRNMDNIRARFFRGAGGEFKYHMMKWSTVCRPKKFGGLGAINSLILNECLMSKWIWKLYHDKDGLWARLLRVKYMRDGDFYKSKSNGGSRF
jgi:hypothetical protein